MRTRSWIALVVAGITLAVGITLFSPLASGNPDGLERVAADKAFIDEARDPGYEIIPGYTFPGVENEALATILSGIAGVLIVAALGFGAGLWARSQARSRASSAGDHAPRTTATSPESGGA